MPWQVLFHVEFVAEFRELAEPVQDEITALADLLRSAGPLLKRPHTDTVNDSRFANLKELHFNAESGVCRFAYAFDPERAILLVAGDKSGVSEKRFYQALIAKADRRFAAYLNELREGSMSP